MHTCIPSTKSGWARRSLGDELPGIPISLSSEILREEQEYERTATTVVNAYVRPLMSGYVGDIRSGLESLGTRAPLMVMQSSGGVMTADDAIAQPVFALESGPAAGVVAAVGLAERLGYRNVITFDMGGTTAKASLIEDGRVSRSQEYEVGASLSAGSRLLRGSGELIRIPTIDIAEVGAGEAASRGWIPPGVSRLGHAAPVRFLDRPDTASAGWSQPSPMPTSPSVTSQRAPWPRAISPSPRSKPIVRSGCWQNRSLSPHSRWRGVSTNWRTPP